MAVLTLSLPIKVALLEVEFVHVTRENIAYKKLEECAEHYRSKYGQTSIGEIDGVQVSRRLFRALGIDPIERNDCRSRRSTVGARVPISPGWRREFRSTPCDQGNKNEQEQQTLPTSTP